jgi:predicted RNase H-like HicB family nuclease
LQDQAQGFCSEPKAEINRTQAVSLLPVPQGADENQRTGNARSLFAVDFLGRGFNSRRLHQFFMKISVIVHKAEEGGFWAEVPAIPGCATQGETMDELLSNVREAVEGCLSTALAT